ncbi:hypothetical protein [Curtobacterium sp. MCBA15_004]|uniref:hypothetical protein n=1 Tax=Curtobacterium sp. MCBA15_004 TaxID=1898733 RepID=UPI0008DDE8C4|nr:hypothetical protein [Curtobacterium sp. MCBA15_004]WIA97607.1 hypothetical protein QOL16_04225 [Curtobacterium sp. MCBA15_004]
MAGEIVQGFGVSGNDRGDRLDRVLIGLDELDGMIGTGTASDEALKLIRDAIRTLTDEVRDIRGGLL